jgi:type II secretory pathway component PulC
MKKQTMIYLSLVVLFSIAVFADTLPNPFTPHVFIKQVQPVPVNSGDLVGSNPTTDGQTSVHPLKAFDTLQYSVKGVILSKDDSIVIINAGPGKDYFARKGDVIGSNGAILEKVLKDKVVFVQGKKKVIIKVRNTEETARYGY